MTPAMVSRMREEIAHLHALLRLEERWLRTQPYGDVRTEQFERIDWYRKKLNDAAGTLPDVSQK